MMKKPFKIGDEVYIDINDYESKNGIDYSEWIWKIIKYDNKNVILECTNQEQSEDYFFDNNDLKDNKSPYRVLTRETYVHTLKYPISKLESIN